MLLNVCDRYIDLYTELNADFTALILARANAIGTITTSFFVSVV
jgi:hypothetical protein